MRILNMIETYLKGVEQHARILGLIEERHQRKVQRQQKIYSKIISEVQMLKEGLLMGQ